jgi:Ca2+-transporting ATPase
VTLARSHHDFSRESRLELSSEEASQLGPTDLARALRSGIAEGLTNDEAARRLDIFGPNDPFSTSAPAWPSILGRQLSSKLIILLLVATGISLLLAEWLNAAAIGITLIASVAFGFFNEFRSERAVAALRNLATPTAEVVRQGLHEEVAATEVVPGDLLSLAEGSLVPADARLVEVRGLLVNESMLTGEPVGVQKATRTSADAVEGRNETLVFAGTAVASGSGLALVISTGSRTELGRISSAVLSSERSTTPLERRIEQLGNNLVIAFLALCSVVVLIGLAQGREAILVLEIAVALAIGAVPETTNSGFKSPSASEYRRPRSSSINDQKPRLIVQGCARQAADVIFQPHVPRPRIAG